MSDKPNFLSLLHGSVLVSDTEKALDFYCGVLGMALDTSRPDLSFPGAWLRIGDQQIHLLELPNPDPVGGRPDHAGRDRHLALAVRDLAALRAALDAAGIPYTASRSGRAALFCRDPDGNGLEFVQA
ncbi:MAG: VOC family protein [Gammaproteobacteria bacterium]